MSGERTIIGLIFAKIFLICSLYICLLIPSPLSKLIVSGVTFALWNIIFIFPYFSYKQAAQGRPLFEFKKNFNPNQSTIFVIFFTVVFGFFSVLSLLGFLTGIMAPLMKDKAYNLDTAKLISIMSIAGIMFTNSLASYFGFRRYHRHNQPCG